MGIMDKIKGLLKGKEHHVKQGIDKVSDTVEQKVPAHAEKIDAASDKAKDVVDKLAGTDTPDTPATTAPTVTPTSPPAASTPPPTSRPPATTPPPAAPPTSPPADTVP